MITLLFLTAGVLSLTWVSGNGGNGSKPPIDEERAKREYMVRTQIEARGIRDPRVLRAMREVPRHRFVPESLRSQAYTDGPLPIGEGQTISQPYIVALMTELLDLHGNEKVLEIGTGSGYQAAILAELSKEVYTIEIIPSLATKARKVLDSLGYQNIFTRIGNGYFGWPEKAPFDRIILTAAPPEIPSVLVDQLSSDNGRMVLPIGTWDQDLILIIKTPKGIEKRNITPVRFVPMINPDEPKTPPPS